MMGLDATDRHWVSPLVAVVLIYLNNLPTQTVPKTISFFVRCAWLPKSIDRCCLDVTV
jgi:hypothetical protein